MLGSLMSPPANPFSWFLTEVHSRRNRSTLATLLLGPGEQIEGRLH